MQINNTRKTQNIMNTKRNYKPLYLTLIGIILISNTPPVTFFLQPHYHYQTRDGKFSYTEEPGKALDYDIMKIRYQRYLNQQQTNQDKTLYRTFRFKPWQFWQWWEMTVRNGRFRLPYMPRTSF
jgi:hypothetical protein